jgi:hypothetical protein
MHNLTAFLEQIFIIANIRLAVGVIEFLELIVGFLFLFWLASIVEQHGAIFRRRLFRSKKSPSADTQVQTTDALLSQGIDLLRHITTQTTPSKK